MIPSIALVLASAAIQTPAAPSPPCTVAQSPDCLAGSWVGYFTGADWTFTFIREGGVWSGRYMSSKGKTWRPMLGLKVAGSTITFGIEARPAVTYTLRLDPAADTLSGTVDIGGFHTLPFTATRSS